MHILEKEYLPLLFVLNRNCEYRSKVQKICGRPHNVVTVQFTEGIMVLYVAVSFVSLTLL